MANVVTKYILIPEFKPLFAMAKCYGPTKGPLEKPCPTPINIIGQLLQQSGTDAVTVYEVVKKSNGSFSEPVQLTLDNYTLSYDRIKNGETIPKNNGKAVHQNSVVPTIKVPEKNILRNVNEMIHTTDEITREPEPPVEEVKEPEVEEVKETAPEEPAAAPAETNEPVEDTSEVTEEKPPVVEEKTEEPTKVIDPYAGMTKAQRREARKAAMRNTSGEKTADNQ